MPDGGERSKTPSARETSCAGSTKAWCVCSPARYASRARKREEGGRRVKRETTRCERAAAALIDRRQTRCKGTAARLVLLARRTRWQPISERTPAFSSPARASFVRTNELCCCWNAPLCMLESVTSRLVPFFVFKGALAPHPSASVLLGPSPRTSRSPRFGASASASCSSCCVPECYNSQNGRRCRPEPALRRSRRASAPVPLVASSLRLWLCTIRAAAEFGGLSSLICAPMCSMPMSAPSSARRGTSTTT